MARRRRSKSKESLFELGLKVAAGGAALLVVPLLMGSSPMFDGLKTVLRMPGWVLLIVGGLILLLNVLIKKKRGQPTAEPAAASTPPRRAPRPPAVGAEQTATRRSLTTADGRTEPAFEPDATAPAHVRLTRWSPEVFAAIEWRRFEAVCEALFTQAGFETRAQSHGPDGGVDIWLHSRNAAGPVAVVQCKH